MDTNFRSYSDENEVRIVGEDIVPTDGVDWDDTLKFSHCTNSNVSFCTILGSSEDAVDMNRECENITLFENHIFTKGAYGVTIKGGSRTVCLQKCVFHGEPKSGYDIDLGNWSDQSDKLTVDVGLEDVTHVSGRPVRVRVLWAKKPIIVGGNVKVTTTPRFLVAIYRFFRRLFK